MSADSNDRMKHGCTAVFFVWCCLIIGCDAHATLTDERLPPPETGECRDRLIHTEDMGL